MSGSHTIGCCRPDAGHWAGAVAATSRRNLLARVLAALLLTAAPISAAGQAPPPGGQREQARWASSGFGPEEAAEWQRVGIAPAEARQWVQAGIPYAQWANQWKGEGFGPADAKVWVEAQVNVYTAGNFKQAGFSPAEATRWIASGVRSAKRAQEFRHQGFSPAEADAWWKLEFFPEDAGSWRRAGFSAAEALEWKYGPKEFHYTRDGFRGYSRQVFPLEWARQWKQGGFRPAEAQQARSFGVDAAEAIRWNVAGFGLGEAMEWRDSGFNPTEAAQKRAAGLSPVQAEDARDAASGAPGDVITELHSDIILRPDARVLVTETISLENKPGGPVAGCFRRSFPARTALRSRGSSFVWAWPSYTVISVLGEGHPVPYTVEKDRGGDITLCVGDRGAPLRDGAHTFTLRYATDDRLVGLRDRDILFFDVTGPDLQLGVRSATATVHLPRGADTVQADGFAGLRDRKAFSAAVRETAEGDVISYMLSRPLKPEMGFQVSIALTKGSAQPGILWRARRFDRATGRMLSSLLVSLAGLTAGLLYFLLAWHRVGRNPKRGPAVPAYDPPDGISPALMRHILTRGRTDDRALAATLVRLAQCGTLDISEREGIYQLRRTGSGATPACAAHEEAALAGLLAGGDQLLIGAVRARQRLRAARAGLHKALRREFGTYFAANTRYLWPGLAMCAAGAMLGLAVLDPAHEGRTDTFRLVYASTLVASGGLLGLLFYFLLRAPTPLGRKVLDGIEGFRLFLGASYGRIRAPGGAAATAAPPFLARQLPYAMALGIDSEQASILAGRPAWYRGRSGGFSPKDFSASLRRRTARAVKP